MRAENIMEALPFSLKVDFIRFVEEGGLICMQFLRKELETSSGLKLDLAQYCQVASLLTTPRNTIFKT
jgi:hypothetical protein